MMSSWPFKDAENTAVFTSKKIIGGNDWIQYVAHDADDGAWQFHPCGGSTPEHDAAVVSLKSIVALDNSLLGLADLPLGWHAWRKSKSSSWERSLREQ